MIFHLYNKNSLIKHSNKQSIPTNVYQLWREEQMTLAEMEWMDGKD